MSFAFFLIDDPAYRRKIHAEIIGNLPLTVPVFLNRPDDRLIALQNTPECLFGEYLLKGRSARIALAPGYLGNVFGGNLGDVDTQRAFSQIIT